MIHALFGRLHAAVLTRLQMIRSLAGEAGQGTVEYVGLILLVSLLMVGMVAAMKGFNRNLSKGGYYKTLGRNHASVAIAASSSAIERYFSTFPRTLCARSPRMS